MKHSYFLWLSLCLGLGLTFGLGATLTPTPALAHKVIASVFASGRDIEGEVGMSNGEMAANEVVEVFDEDGRKLGETKTDADGFFLYTPNEPITHIFRANLGAGHLAEAVMLADEVSEIVSKANPATSNAPAAGATIAFGASPTPAGDTLNTQTPVADPSSATLTYAPAPIITVAALNDEEKEAIAKIVRDETRPLRKEIAAYKEKNNLQTILGGIGYIVGLFGVGFYVAANRKLKAAA